MSLNFYRGVMATLFALLVGTGIGIIVKVPTGVLSSISVALFCVAGCCAIRALVKDQGQWIPMALVVVLLTTILGLLWSLVYGEIENGSAALSFVVPGITSLSFLIGMIQRPKK